MKVSLIPGAIFKEEAGTHFRLWAPAVEEIEVHLFGQNERYIRLDRSDGYHEALVRDAGPGSRYLFRLNGEREHPDPASRYQPEGVHGPSAVVDMHYPWSDQAWRGIRLQDYVIYELHVGTFSERGTFEAIIEHLPRLRDLGITALELMPVAQFPGTRNWGYDGVYPYATQNSYGGPRALQQLVDAAHGQEMAVVLDVVYNHLGPEGNYLREYGPYFTSRYSTPWGDAINFDGPLSDHVRDFFVQNALHWITDFHIDALRLDAVHAIADQSAYPFLRELADTVHQRAGELGRAVYLIAESDLNDPRVIYSPERRGLGLDTQWSDDFHHSLHALLTGERAGYYEDFGELQDLASAYSNAFVYANNYSKHRRRKHGEPVNDVETFRFLAYAQTHDQIGNRMNGERLSTLVSFEKLKVAAAAVHLSPFLPLLFMGEEYGETAPFLYFCSHSDEVLIEAVRKGRSEEFASFGWETEPPDPQAESTFLESRLNQELAGQARHAILLTLHRELIALRKHQALQSFSFRDISAEVRSPRLLILSRSSESGLVFIAFNFDQADADLVFPAESREWKKVLASNDHRRCGDREAPDLVAPSETLSLPPHSFVVYERGE